MIFDNFEVSNIDGTKPKCIFLVTRNQRPVTTVPKIILSGVDLTFVTSFWNS